MLIRALTHCTDFLLGSLHSQNRNTSGSKAERSHAAQSNFSVEGKFISLRNIYHWTEIVTTTCLHSMYQHKAPFQGIILVLQRADFPEAVIKTSKLTRKSKQGKKVLSRRFVLNLSEDKSLQLQNNYFVSAAKTAIYTKFNL